MQEILITFETAKLAKEKGFDVPTLNFYGLPNKTLYVLKNGEPLNPQNHNNNELVGKNRASAPTQSLLQKWLREVHDIHVNPNHTYTKSNVSLGHNLSVESGKYKYIGKFIYGNSYEEVLENGLQEALKLIK